MTGTEQRLWDAKASRFTAAINLVPFARALEVVPFPLLLGPTRPRVLADLMAGSGYLARFLSRCCERVVGLDVSSEMLRRYPQSARIESLQVEARDQAQVLRATVKPNSIVCIAGLHHVYEVQSDGSVDRAASTLGHGNLLCTWADALPDDGVLVVADITDPDCASDMSKCSVPRRMDGQLSALLDDLRGAIGRSLDGEQPIPANRPRSICELVTEVCTAMPSARTAQPGRWFREIVDSAGEFGHMDCFLNPKGILDIVHAKGLVARFHELPTPWLFPNEESYLWYMYDKFAFGAPVTSVACIPAATREMILSETESFLGIDELENGALSVGWRLGFYEIRKTQVTVRSETQ